eukprot:6197835-Pleurochrysis_carterae.AAC.4
MQDLAVPAAMVRRIIHSFSEEEGGSEWNLLCKLRAFPCPNGKGEGHRPKHWHRSSVLLREKYPVSMPCTRGESLCVGSSPRGVSDGWSQTMRSVFRARPSNASDGSPNALRAAIRLLSAQIWSSRKRAAQHAAQQGCQYTKMTAWHSASAADAAAAGQFLKPLQPRSQQALEQGPQAAPRSSGCPPVPVGARVRAAAAATADAAANAGASARVGDQRSASSSYIPGWTPMTTSPPSHHSHISIFTKPLYL